MFSSLVLVPVLFDGCRKHYGVPFQWEGKRLLVVLSLFPAENLENQMSACRNEAGRGVGSGLDRPPGTQTLSHILGSKRTKQAGLSARDLIVRGRHKKPVITFCREIDGMLGGGVPRGELTEVSSVGYHMW